MGLRYIRRSVAQRLRLVPLICLLFFALAANGQQFLVTGVILDAETQSPLPFVNLVLNDGQEGTATDIDGRFSFSSKQKPYRLQATYVGYHPLDIKLGPNTNRLQLEMHAKAYQLGEVEVVPRNNPALRIIKNATAYRKLNDPSRNSEFSYSSYNKTRYFLDFTEDLNLDSLRKEMPDAPDYILKYLNNKLLFMNETHIKTYYERPDKKKDVVKAVRSSGFDSPEIYSLPTDFQPLGFYDAYINILDKNYLNPISPGSTKKYVFELQDTLAADLDTVFIISFQPSTKSNFDGLKGVLAIHTNQWAIKNVIAQSAEGTFVDFKLQQQYEFINDEAWFPTQLTADVSIDSMFLRLEHRSYIEDISFVMEPPPSVEKPKRWRKKTFNYLKTEIEPESAKKDSMYWMEVRPIKLTAQEEITYMALDSLDDQIIDLDRFVKLTQYLVNGYVPIGAFNADLTRIGRWNFFEGTRLGLGVSTNDKISKYLEVGGWFGYGFKDQLFKGGGFVNLALDRLKNNSLRLEFANDLLNPGTYDFYQPVASNTVQITDNRSIRDMLKHEYYRASLSNRIFNYLETELSVAQSAYEEIGGYTFQKPGWAESSSTYETFETRFKLRYAYRDKLEVVLGRLFSYGSKFPVFHLDYTRGWELTNYGDLAFDRLIVRAQYGLRASRIGKPFISIEGGITNGTLPRSHLFMGNGTAAPRSSLDMPLTFQTMRPYEFIADRYAGMHYRHYIGQVKTKSEKCNPHFTVAQSVAIGSLSNPGVHSGLNAQSYERGYFEGGLIIDQLYKMPFSYVAYIGFGAGVYYRYGPYALPDWLDNAALRMSATVTF